METEQLIKSAGAVPALLTAEEIIRRLRDALAARGWKSSQFCEDYNYDAALDYADFVGEFLHSVGGTDWRVTIETSDDEGPEYFHSSAAELVARRTVEGGTAGYTLTETHVLPFPLEGTEGEAAEVAIHGFAEDVAAMLRHTWEQSAARPLLYFATLPGNGLTLALPAHVAEDETTLRDTIRPLYLAIDNADLVREQGDGATYIKITPRVGRKGCREDCPHNTPPEVAARADAPQRPGRIFRKTTITLVVLSVDDEGPRPKDLELDALHEAITTGDCSGCTEAAHEIEVSPQEMVRLLKGQGSDPSFFSLDEEGRALDDETEDETETGEE